MIRVMRKPDERHRLPGADYEIVVIGARRAPLSDFYHALLRWSWTLTFGVVSAAWLAANALFALAYVAVGGIAHGREGDFADAFFFSIQTMGTIGYGAVYPESLAANVLVVAESLVGLILTALATGLVFAKFSRSTARVVFSREATISPVNGVPTLAIRIGNERSNRIVDAQIRIALARTETTTEGRIFYRNVDLVLVRDRLLSLSRSWAVLHTIDERSPLHGMDAARFAAEECELHVMVTGTDETTMQPVHALHTWFAADVLWGRRHVDVLSTRPDGNLVLDLRKFHETEAVTSSPRS
jgi:inward rectifier potassium channel